MIKTEKIVGKILGKVRKIPTGKSRKSIRRKFIRQRFFHALPPWWKITHISYASDGIFHLWKWKLSMNFDFSPKVFLQWRFWPCMERPFTGPTLPLRFSIFQKLNLDKNIKSCIFDFSLRLLLAPQNWHFFLFFNKSWNKFHFGAHPIVYVLF